ncbi:hypothetical protein [Epilithonimonas xixisoli]|uniref:Uncharacterized protein n=1 Tax=Epilithonimonas xixisoli TaxID=1476462 RepID=A0A4R8IKS6_9FLAO|nr:hypothetical protein [Epilithonimonas xixisoli]TDX87279.1 hypothetical protein B0I22_1467 [Epilithonimonas xixisoli]
MAKLKKNGNLSGAIGNFIFVNKNGKLHVQQKSKTYNQSPNSENAAVAYGQNSNQDRAVRQAITEKIYIRNYHCFVVNHRTRIQKTMVQTIDAQGESSIQYTNPQPMVGTIFNNDWDWEKATNFYPDYDLDADQVMTVKIPQLTLGKQIKLPRNAEWANLKMYAFTIDPNQKNPEANILSSLSLDLEKNKNVPAQDWVFDMPKDAFWALVIATISYTSGKNNIAEEQKHTGTYLWAKKIQD